MLIDVSNHQGSINWAAADPAIDGAYCKVTEGTSFVDGRWRANHDGARAGGKPVGAYHFADLGDPVAEANHFADVYLSAAWQLRPVLDIETAGATAAWVKAFRAQFRARVGATPFRVYSSLSLLTGALSPSGWIDANSDIWVAAYRSVLGWTHPQAVLWQNTSAATVPGVLGSVDADQYLNGWTPAADYAPTPPPAPAPTPQPYVTPTSPEEDSMVIAPAGTDEHITLVVQGKTRIVLGCGYEDKVTIHAIDYWGSAASGWNSTEVGVGGHINQFPLNPNEPLDTPIPAGAVIAVVRYTASHSFGAGAA